MIDGARRRFGEAGPFRFVRRAITRPETAGGEDHLALSPDEFERRAAANAFALHWSAHGLRYGVPSDVHETIAGGRSVVPNLSRSVLDAMRAQFPKRRIIVVTASPTMLARRLSARGRESAADIEARLARAPEALPEGSDVMTVWNDGLLAEAQADFDAALTG